MRLGYGLTARLMLVNGGLVVGTALVLSALSLYFLNSQLSSNVQVRLEATRAMAATILELRIDNLATVAAQMSGDGLAVRAIETRDAGLAQSLAGRTGGSTPAVWLLLATPTGTQIASNSGLTLEAADVNTLLQEAFQGRSSRGLARAVDCRIISIAAAPVRANDSIVGALLLASPLGTEFLDEVQVRAHANAWLLCGSQVFTAVSHAARLEVDASLLDAALQRRQVSLGTSRLDGVDGTGYYVPMVDFQDRVAGMYGLSQPIQDIFDTRDNSSRLYLLLVLAIAGIVLLEANLLARRITRPLIRLTQATQAIAAGDLNTPVSEKGRDEIGRLALSFDTMRVRLAATYADLARERNRYRDFLGLMPHEFRTPLAALAASLELLETDAEDLSGDQRQLVGSIHRSVIRLHSLVDNLLDTASIQAGQFQVHAEPTMLGPIIDEARLYIQPLLDQKQQGLCVQVQAPLPEVMADSRRVTQVLINLLSNAHKYGPVGEPLTLAAARADRVVRVSVADLGPGISPDDQSGLFQRFIRSGSKGTTSVAGIGFGLAITREIIEMHHGQVGIDSSLGKGTTVWFSLPLAATAEEPRPDLGDERESSDR
jgi:two-component system, OmpR family, sensor histidine kinase BaeS